MLKIRFYNELGQIIFTGGTGSIWRLTAAEGLAMPPRTFITARYSGQAGQETTQTIINSRTVTLSGDVRCYEGFHKEYTNAVAALEKEGILEITTQAGKRQTAARCCEFYCGEKKGTYILFTIQFICDDPYFEDTIKTEVPIFCQIPLLGKETRLPAMFSKRISRRELIYTGNAETEPIFHITAGDGPEGENCLSIINHTGNEMISFDYGASKNNSVTVDIKHRCIYNSDGESLLKYLKDDSFFDGFHLYPGVNDIEVINRNMNTGLLVTCSYSNKYSEAVYI